MKQDRNAAGRTAIFVVVGIVLLWFRLKQVLFDEDTIAPHQKAATTRLEKDKGKLQKNYAMRMAE